MNILFAILTFSLFCYGVFTLLAALTWFSKKEKKNVQKNRSFVSVVIAARNEAGNINSCLKSIIQQNYPKESFEIIVVDDCSEDDTSLLVKKVKTETPGTQITLIELKENKFFKKGALAQGIQRAKGEIIVVRDADTISPSSGWLASVADSFEIGTTAMLICPVAIESSGNNFGEIFQLCENYTLQVVGGGAALLGIPFLCNGASLAFDKSAFNTVKGFEGNEKIASGDDIFLLEKFRRKYRNGVKYCTLKESVVYTMAEKSFSAFVHQKIRWASKFSKTANAINFFLGILVFLINFLFLFLVPLSFIFGGWYKYLALSLCIKWIIDFLLLILASSGFKNWSWLKWFIPLELMNVFYSVFIPLAVLFIKPQWRGRKI